MKPRHSRRLPIAVLSTLLFAIARPAAAHDTWVETNTNLIRTGDAVYVALKLGNHGNDHRDFKQASKIGLSGSTLEAVAPDGRTYDLVPALVDEGYAPKEGYWQAEFVPAEPGLYVASHTLDSVVNHGTPTRSVKSGKTYFAVAERLDDVKPQREGFGRPLGHALELVPTANPVLPMGPGVPIAVRLLFRGEPLTGARVSFVPRSETLAEGFDDRYERTTDTDGRASFTPRTGERYLVVAHHHSDEAGDGFSATAYSATLTVLVPEICPCCK